MKKPNGNERRAKARHAAWAQAARALRMRPLEAPPGLASGEAALFWTTLARVQDYLDARAAGRLPSPPGGVIR